MAMRLKKNSIFLQKLKDQRIIDILEEAEGDRIIESREVRHFLHFKNEIDMQRSIIFLKKESFKILSKDRFENKYILVLTHFEAPSIITKTTIFMLNVALEFNADYDGWETSILANSPKLLTQI